mgnify:FL=1
MFKRKFGITPARYILGELIRKGARKFEYDKLEPEGRLMLYKLRRLGLTNFDSHSSEHITKNALKIATSKKPRMRYR